MIEHINGVSNPFFIGIGGAGMSAIAIYLQQAGKQVSGSDRLFTTSVQSETKHKLEASGIKCFAQDGTGITADTGLVVVSTAIEDTVYEVVKARELNIPIIKRSELLAIISQAKKTIAIGGTSGKSTTVAMLYEILSHAGLEPGVITGAGLTSLIDKNDIGNAKLGKGDWLVIEADESDGSIVQYKPEIGVLLNVEKDHKNLESLHEIFAIFKANSKHFIVNQSNENARKLSADAAYDFSTTPIFAGIMASEFIQNSFIAEFRVNGLLLFTVPIIGRHNMENACAAIAVATRLGISLEVCAAALKNYKGIYRRTAILGNKNGVWLIDDYAHNPAKCAAAINACKALAPKLIAWFQPHGYTPTKFLRAEFVEEIAAALRPDDEIWMSEIYYAGGTAVKDISAANLIDDLKARHANAFFVEDRNELLPSLIPHFTGDCILLMMGARDPSLEEFVKNIWNSLPQNNS